MAILRTEWEEPHLEVAALLHQSYLTGLILYLLQKKGPDAAAELMFRTFRRQHEEKFAAGLETLGLSGLPDAVACAQFIYLANAVGGVAVEYMPESDRKAWVRYPPPRWIYEGAALCAVPPEVPTAFMRAFHAHCGPGLGNPRLGFVCTMMVTDGEPGLEGYFVEEDRELGANERLRFAPGESGPPFDPTRAPPLPFAGARLEKAKRNYALQYIRVALCELTAMAPDEGTRLGREAAVLVGMQLYSQAAAILGTSSTSADAFAGFVVDLLRGCGDEPSLEAISVDPIVTVPSLRILSAERDTWPAAFDAWCGLLQGAASVHRRGLSIEPISRCDRGDDAWRWRLRDAG